VTTSRVGGEVKAREGRTSLLLPPGAGNPSYATAPSATNVVVVVVGVVGVVVIIFSID